MSDVITTRELEDSDVGPILDLLRAALGEPALLKRTPALFEWKHFNNPFGRSIAVVAESAGRVVGLRAFMRWDIGTPDGSTLRCVRAVDTATHPDFQRRGIFRKLTEEGLEIAVAQDVDLVFNTPNEKSGAGYLSMGWKEVGPIGVLVRPSRRMLAGQRPDTSGSPTDYLDQPTPASDLDVADRPPRGLRTTRSHEYLRWRFESHPTARYFRVDSEGSTAVVRPNLRSGRRELVIVDVFGPQPGTVIRKALLRSRARYVAAWFSPGSPERTAAVRRGLVPVPGFAPMTLVAKPLREIGIDVFDMRNWDFAVSDLELL